MILQKFANLFESVVFDVTAYPIIMPSDLWGGCAKNCPRTLFAVRGRFGHETCARKAVSVCGARLLVSSCRLTDE